MEKETIAILLIEEEERSSLPFTHLHSSYLPPLSSLVRASTLNEALAILEIKRFDLIVLDPFLTDSKGLETFIKLFHRAQNTPFVLLIDKEHETIAFNALSLGAEDFIARGEEENDKVAKVLRGALERHVMKEALYSLSFTDPLTGIYNRRGFMMLSLQQIEMAKRSQASMLLLLIDVDGLKVINDTFGHQEGDHALIDTVECLKRTFRTSDIIGRIGGDEFAVLMMGVHENSEELFLKEVQMNLELINATFQRPYILSMSIGTAFFKPHLEDVSLNEILQMADKLLYLAKNEKY